MPRAKRLIAYSEQPDLAGLFETTTGEWRPRTRADCVGRGLNACRPCCYVECRYHLYGELDPDTGDYVTYHRPGGEVDWDRVPMDLAMMTETCALDVAERGGATLEEVAVLVGVNTSRCDVIETEALSRARRKGLQLRLLP